jgi:hypothetical protein
MNSVISFEILIDNNVELPIQLPHYSPSFNCNQGNEGGQ